MKMEVKLDVELEGCILPGRFPVFGKLRDLEYFYFSFSC